MLYVPKFKPIERRYRRLLKEPLQIDCELSTPAIVYQWVYFDGLLAFCVVDRYLQTELFNEEQAYFVPLPCFNPTMVRLLRELFLSSNGRKQKFQSHNGAIAAKQVPRHHREVAQFQSHNGAIAAGANPITVPLTIAFQSHNGAIAASGEVMVH